MSPRNVSARLNSTRRQAGAVTAEYAMVALGAVLFGVVFLLVIRTPAVHDLLLGAFLRLFGWLFTLDIL